MKDADQAWLDAAADRIKNCHKSLYKATEGYMEFGRQQLADKLMSGNVVIESLDKTELVYVAKGARAACVSNPDRSYYIILCGAFTDSTFLHEFGHGQFEKYFEEYNCTSCVMGMFEQTKYCDWETCVGATWPDIEATDCWGNFILVKYQTWVHTGVDPGGPAHNCEVVITNF